MLVLDSHGAMMEIRDANHLSNHHLAVDVNLNHVVVPTTPSPGGKKKRARTPTSPLSPNPLDNDELRRGSTGLSAFNEYVDLVKRHLMYAVREEVEILKQQIGEMMERISQLEYENTVLRSEAKQETLNKLLMPRVTQAQQPPQPAPVVTQGLIQPPAMAGGQQVAPVAAQPVASGQPGVPVQPQVQPAGTPSGAQTTQATPQQVLQQQQAVQQQQVLQQQQQQQVAQQVLQQQQQQAAVQPSAPVPQTSQQQQQTHMVQQPGQQPVQTS